LPVADWQIYSFYDFGAVWNKDPVPGEDPRHTLASTGGGWRFNVNPSVSGYVEIAKPVTNRVHSVSEDAGKDPRFFFGLVGKF
jgi:hemolysin activation/secretion protein